MGTSKSGRYLNTKGSKYVVSDYSAVHSNEGTFKWMDDHIDGKPVKILRLASGGHGQKGMDLLKKHQLEYNVVKTYSNGVRVGYIVNHGDKTKRSGTNQAWFPSAWTEKDIKHAGEYVAKLKCNKNIPDGNIMWGNWKGVRVGAIKTRGKIATISPDSNQTYILKKRRRRGK